MRKRDLQQKDQVSGIIGNAYELHALLKELEERGGYGKEEISLLMSEETRDEFAQEERALHGMEGTTVGAKTGGMTGGIVGALVGAMATSGFLFIPIPGIGIFVAGVLAGLASGATLGAMSGGLIGMLVGVGVPPEEAKYYEEALMERGTVLVVVHTTPNETQGVRDMLDRHGAFRTKVAT